MQAFSTFVITIFGMVSAPYVVKLIQAPIPTVWTWIPWLMALLLGILLAIPKGLRPCALGYLAGLLGFWLALEFIPEQIRYVPLIPKPFY